MTQIYFQKNSAVTVAQYVHVLLENQKVIHCKKNVFKKIYLCIFTKHQWKWSINYYLGLDPPVKRCPTESLVVSQESKLIVICVHLSDVPLLPHCLFIRCFVFQNNFQFANLLGKAALVRRRRRWILATTWAWPCSPPLTAHSGFSLRLHPGTA